MAGTLTIGTLSDGTNSTSATNAIKGSAKAWVNFNGTGTVAIRGSYNVSSITDNGTGDYTVNFTNAMSDTNYSANVTACNPGGYAMGTLYQTSPMATGSVRVVYCGFNSALYDATVVSVAVFR
jgi:hypothetical protein